MSRKNAYYSVRTGKNPYSEGFELPIILKLFKSAYLKLDSEGYFQQAFGFWCVDMDYVPGSLGEDIESAIMTNLRKENLWPVQDKALGYSEDDLFDVIEFLYDYVSKPINGDYHSYNDCGWHYKVFNKIEGQVEFRNAINAVLESYRYGFDLSADGEILEAPQEGYEVILSADLPNYDPENVESKVKAAVFNFRRARATFEDRKNAIRDLADVLEFLRPQLKMVMLSQDENDLFNIANNFGIRHHNDKQKIDYDKRIWYSWLFYYYLSTIHAFLHLIKKSKATDQ